jgi:uncharacterized protein (TIGR00251 family)
MIARIVDGGLTLRVRVTPKASRDEILGPAGAGEDGGALQLRVRAAPEDGKANLAVAQLIAKWLGVPKSSVELRSGGRSRIKTFCIEGDGKSLLERLEKRLADLHNGTSP